MIGNTNASTRGGGSTLKVLNVNMVGTLNRDDTTISGFSASNKLKLASRLENNSLNLDVTNYTKNIADALSKADTWEMQVKIKSTEGPIFGQEGYVTDYFLWYISGGVVKMRFVSGASGNGTTMLLENIFYWVKLVFTGTKYICSLSTTGAFSGEETIEFETTTTQKIANNSAAWSLCGSDSSGMTGGLDLSGCYIKINGEYWWKGVEEIKL